MSGSKQTWLMEDSISLHVLESAVKGEENVCEWKPGCKDATGEAWMPNSVSRRWAFESVGPGSQQIFSPSSLGLIQSQTLICSASFECRGISQISRISQSKLYNVSHLWLTVVSASSVYSADVCGGFLIFFLVLFCFLHSCKLASLFLMRFFFLSFPNSWRYQVPDYTSLYRIGKACSLAF